MMRTIATIALIAIASCGDRVPECQEDLYRECLDVALESFGECRIDEQPERLSCKMLQTASWCDSTHYADRSACAQDLHCEPSLPLEEIQSCYADLETCLVDCDVAGCSAEFRACMWR